MKKLNLERYENSILILLLILVFFTINSLIPKYISIFGIILLSFYFFPLKLIVNDFKWLSKLILFSEIIISISLALLILGFYLDNKLIISIFSLLNFIYLVFFAYKFENSKENSKSIYRKIIINHFLLIFLLQLVNYS